MPPRHTTGAIRRFLQAIQSMVQTTRYEHLSERDRQIFRIAVENLYNAHTEDFEDVFLSYSSFCYMFPSLDRFVLGKDYIHLNKRSKLPMSFVIQRVLERMRDIALEGTLQRNDAALLEGWAKEMGNIMTERTRVPALLRSGPPKEIIAPVVRREEAHNVDSLLFLLFFVVVWFISLFRRKQASRARSSVPLHPVDTMLLENQLQDMYSRYIDLQNQNSQLQEQIYTNTKPAVQNQIQRPRQRSATRTSASPKQKGVRRVIATL